MEILLLQDIGYFPSYGGGNKANRLLLTELAARGRSLKAVFSRLHGSESERRLNRFVTRLANEASLRSLRKSGYCENAASLMDDSLRLRPDNLNAFVAQQPFSSAHGLAVCDIENQVSEVR